MRLEYIQNIREIRVSVELYDNIFMLIAPFAIDNLVYTLVGIRIIKYDLIFISSYLIQFFLKNFVYERDIS